MKLFPSQKENERVFLLLRRHWFTYLIFWLLAFMLIVPVIVFLIWWPLNPDSIDAGWTVVITVLISCYFLAVLGLLLYGFIDYYLDVYIVTDSRIVDIKQNGLFKREISELHLHQVQDVNAKVNGLFPTLFHYGEVFVQTAGEADNFIFHSVPHPYRISKEIIDLHEKHLHKRTKKTSPETGDENYQRMAANLNEE